MLKYKAVLSVESFEHRLWLRTTKYECVRQILLIDVRRNLIDLAGGCSIDWRFLQVIGQADYIKLIHSSLSLSRVFSDGKITNMMVFIIWFVIISCMLTTKMLYNVQYHKSTVYSINNSNFTVHYKMDNMYSLQSTMGSGDSFCKQPRAASEKGSKAHYTTLHYTGLDFPNELAWTCLSFWCLCKS